MLGGDRVRERSKTQGTIIFGRYFLTVSPMVGENTNHRGNSICKHKQGCFYGYVMLRLM